MSATIMKLPVSVYNLYIFPISNNAVKQISKMSIFISQNTVTFLFTLKISQLTFFFLQTQYKQYYILQVMDKDVDNIV